MRQFILRENVLTDNVLTIPGEGKIFEGGYIAILEEYIFQNSWTDKKEVKKFRSKDRLMKYIDQNYSEEELEFIELD